MEFDDLLEGPMGICVCVVLVEPWVSYWNCNTHDNLTGKRKSSASSMAFRQSPLTSVAVRTVQIAHGMCMDAAMKIVAKLGNVDDDVYWTTCT